MSDPVISYYTNKDSRSMAEMIALSFGDKFKNLTSLDDDDLVSIVEDTFAKNYDESFERCIMSFVDGDAAGMVFLEWGEKPKVKGQFRSFCKRYGFFNALRYSAGLRAMHVTEWEGNCYLAKLVVKEEYRGNGIASELIRKAIEFAGEMGFNTLTLYVSLDNDQAISLYEKMGFERMRTIRSPVEKIMFGVPGWIYMMKFIGV